MGLDGGSGWGFDGSSRLFRLISRYSKRLPLEEAPPPRGCGVVWCSGALVRPPTQALLAVQRREERDGNSAARGGANGDNADCMTRVNILSNVSSYDRDQYD